MKKFLLCLVVGMGSLVLLTHSASAQWVQTNGLDSSYVAALAVSGDTIFAEVQGGVFLTADNGTSWTPVVFTAGLVNAFAVSGSNIFVAASTCCLGGISVFLSTDNGASWTPVNNGLPTSLNPITSLAAIGSIVFAAYFTKGVFLTTNNGASWTAANSGLEGVPVNAFAVSGSNIFAGTVSGVFLSANNGTSWTAVNSGLPANTIVLTLAMSGGRNIFAGTYGGGIFLSTNNGTRWTAVNAGLPANDSINCLAVSGSNIFAGPNSGGVFLSTNNGASWTAVNSGFPVNIKVNSLVVSGSNIFAGTGSGVWRRPLSEMLGVINQKPLRSMLNFNIRSPRYANSNATTEFSLPQPDQVTVKIYNLSGHEIATLVNKNLGSGTHSVTWNTRNVAAGCYLVKMQAGSNSFVKSIPVFK